MSLVLVGLGMSMICAMFLPPWQDMELATPSAEEPLTQVEGDVPVEPTSSTRRCNAVGNGDAYL